jgi:hypothetical protein
LSEVEVLAYGLYGTALILGAAATVSRFWTQKKIADKALEGSSPVDRPDILLALAAVIEAANQRPLAIGRVTRACGVRSRRTGPG